MMCSFVISSEYAHVQVAKHFPVEGNLLSLAHSISKFTAILNVHVSRTKRAVTLISLNIAAKRASCISLCFAILTFYEERICNLHLLYNPTLFIVDCLWTPALMWICCFCPVNLSISTRRAFLVYICLNDSTKHFSVFCWSFISNSNLLSLSFAFLLVFRLRNKAID